MARVKAPLFSVSASGSIKKTLTYTNWKGINVVKQWSKALDLNTQQQQAVRSTYSSGVVSWNALTQGQKEIWNDSSKGKPLTGFNMFMSEFLIANLPLADFGKFDVGKFDVAKFGV